MHAARAFAGAGVPRADRKPADCGGNRGPGGGAAVIYGLYQSAAGMMTSEYAQSVLANNLANADTVGFKRDVAVFAERLRADQAGRRDGPTAEGLGSLSGGTWLGRTDVDFSEG